MTQTKSPLRPADAPSDHWVYRVVPRAWQPWAQLARLDRPIGFWLLLAPCWWALTLAHQAGGEASALLFVLFACGAVTMRAAGCIINDIADRDLDARVARTAARPLASGRLSRAQALIFLACLLGASACIVWPLPRASWWMAAAVLPLIALYPYVKRWSFWPQAVLGLTFNWGVWLGWTAAQAPLAASALWLYAACVCWTIGYDTIYAEQDKADDARLGIKSTALYFGARAPLLVGVCYALALGGAAAAAWLAGCGPGFWLCLPLAAAQLGWQWQQYRLGVRRRASSAHYLRLFRSNGWFGLALFCAFGLGLA